MGNREHPFSLRVDEASMAAYKAAAKEAGMKVSEWARLVLDVSAGIRRVRHVYFIDVAKMDPDEARGRMDEAAKKVREGKW